jgi:hypothetical protein
LLREKEREDEVKGKRREVGSDGEEQEEDRAHLKVLFQVVQTKITF